MDLNLIAPIIKHKPTWDAFVAIIEFEEKKLQSELVGLTDPGRLQHIAGKLTMLDHLKRYRDRHGEER